MKLFVLPSELASEFIYNFESVHTRKSYLADLRSFDSYLSEKFQSIKNVKDLERLHLIEFRNEMQQHEFAPKTVHRRLSTLSSFFDYLLEKNLIEFNPCQAIKRPRQQVRTPTNDLLDGQIIELLNAPDSSTPSGLLHKTLLTCFFMTGLRKSEITQLKICDFYKKDEYYYFHVRAKGGKYLEKLLPPLCSDLVLEYLSAQKQSITKDKDDFLFTPTRNPVNPGKLNKAIDPKSIYYIFKLYAKKIGLSKTISPHSARASFIGSALENGADLWKVAKDVGHASVRTTQDYNKRKLRPKDSPGLMLGYVRKKA